MQDTSNEIVSAKTDNLRVKMNSFITGRVYRDRRRLVQGIGAVTGCPRLRSVRYLVVLVLTIALFSCATVPPVHAEEDAAVYRRLRAEIALSTDLSVSPTPTPMIRGYYRDEIGPLPNGILHDTVAVEALGEPMAVHIFHPLPEPEGGRTLPKGTIFVVHGYLAYPADMGSVIRAMLSHGYLVVAPALPGHGLSAGERAGIRDFSDYGQFISDLLTQLGEQLPTPWHAVGHSTGATALYEYIREYTPLDPDPFTAVVFLAPLVRSTWYRASRIGRFLALPFVSRIPAGVDDPLVPSTMPLSWFDAQVRWNQRAESFAIVTRPILVIQGDLDTVVDWRYNRRFLERKLACLRYELLPQAGHVVHDSDPATRRATINLLNEYIISYPDGVLCE